MIFRIDQQLIEKVDINNFDENGRRLDKRFIKKIEKVHLKE